MNIAMVFDTMIYGGIERVGISYIEIMQQMGHHVDVYILNDNTEEIVEEIKKRCEVIYIPFSRNMCIERYRHHANKNYFMWCLFEMLRFLLWIAKSVMKIRYNSRHKYDVAIAFSGHFNDLTFVSENHVMAKYKIGWLHGAQYQYENDSIGYRMLYKKIKNLVCVSDYKDEEYEEINALYEINKYKIYNPLMLREEKVDIEKIRELNRKYGKFCLTVGRLAEDKDQKTIIKAMKILKDSYGFERELLIVGDGGTRKTLEAYANELGMSNTIHFMGTCWDVQNYYSAAELFIHSSPAEGFGMTLIEAMYYNTPVVSTDSLPGVREILGNDGVYGMISPVGDAEALAENIFKMLVDPKRKQDYILKAKERVKEFSPEEIKKCLTVLFDTIMGNNSDVK